MRREVGDVAADVRMHPLLRFGMEGPLDVLEHRDGATDELVLRCEGGVELAALLIEPVAADYRDHSAGNVAPADFAYDRRACLDSPPALALRLVRARVDQ